MVLLYSDNPAAAGTIYNGGPQFNDIRPPGSVVPGTEGQSGQSSAAIAATGFFEPTTAAPRPTPLPGTLFDPGGGQDPFVVESIDADGNPVPVVGSQTRGTTRTGNVQDLYQRFLDSENGTGPKFSFDQLVSAVKNIIGSLGQPISDDELDRMARVAIQQAADSHPSPKPSSFKSTTISAADRARQEELNRQQREQVSQTPASTTDGAAAQTTEIASQRQAQVLGERVNDIIGLLDTGAIQDPAGLLGIIQRRFGIGAEEAQTIFNTIRNQRQRLLEQQNAQDVFLRGAGEAFGRPVSDFTPFARGALGSAFTRFQNINPITNFFPQQEQGQAFQSFLGAERPTQAGLQTNLDQILSAFNADPTGPQGALFNATFSTPQQAASAAAQPFLAGVAPRLRSSLGNILQRQFASRFALNPEQFQSPQQVAGIFNTFKNQGF